MPMSDQAQSNNQQVIVYALIAIAVLLAVIVGFMIYNNSQGVPAPSVSSTTAPSDTAAANIAAQMPAAPTELPFDPKTATKLPAGMTPEQALKAYNEDIMAKKFPEAYALLPLSNQKGYGDADSYGSTVSQYGITGYKLGKPTTSGNDTTIVSEQDTAQMNITYTWTYTKVGKAWYVKSRTMGGVVE
jgi:hypothetical protein